MALFLWNISTFSQAAIIVIATSLAGLGALRMRNVLLSRAISALFPVSFTMTSPAHADEKTVKGFWQATDDLGKPNAWFSFSEKNGAFEGRLVRAYSKPGEGKTCDKCAGALKGSPMLGLPIVTAMRRDGWPGR
jgi:hypothetical protein